MFVAEIVTEKTKNGGKGNKLQQTAKRPFGYVQEFCPARRSTCALGSVSTARQRAFMSLCSIFDPSFSPTKAFAHAFLHVTFVG